MNSNELLSDTNELTAVISFDILTSKLHQPDSYHQITVFQILLFFNLRAYLYLISIFHFLPYQKHCIKRSKSLRLWTMKNGFILLNVIILYLSWLDELNIHVLLKVSTRLVIFSMVHHVLIAVQMECHLWRIMFTVAFILWHFTQSSILFRQNGKKYYTSPFRKLLIRTEYYKWPHYAHCVSVTMYSKYPAH